MKRTPQPQTIGFRDLVRTGIAPVSTKTAVKYIESYLIMYLGIDKKIDGICPDQTFKTKIPL